MEKDTLVQDADSSLEKLKDDYFELAIKENLAPNTFKSLEQVQKEARVELDIAIQNYQKRLEEGYNLLLKAAAKEDSDQVEDAFVLGAGYTEEEQERRLQDKSPLDFYDKEKLEIFWKKRDEGTILLVKLAEQELTLGTPQNASDMFFVITVLFPECAQAWIGWAQSEQKLDHLKESEDIFLEALSSFPENIRVCFAAARFFKEINKNEEGKNILSNLLQSLQKARDFDNVDLLIKQVQIILSELD